MRLDLQAGVILMAIRLNLKISERDEESNFEVVYGRKCMTRSGRSVRHHDWCVWILGLLLMAIRLNLKIS